MQFENITKRFEDFETLMENNEYTEVPTILKAIDELLKHMEVVIDELPSIVLIAEGHFTKKNGRNKRYLSKNGRCWLSVRLFKCRI